MTLRRLLAFVAVTALVAVGTVGCDKSPKQHAVGDNYPDKVAGFQTELPSEGDTVAIMHTSMGDIYIRLFPEAAPKAVENFTTHAKNGYYDGLTFHRVIEDFMIQGGDPNGDGTGGDSIYPDGAFEDEFDKKLLNIRGALAMANSGVNTNGSQFFINQARADSFSREDYAYDSRYEQMKDLYEQYCNYYAQQGMDFTDYCADVDAFIEANGGIHPDKGIEVPEAVWEAYEANGGNISLDGAWRYTGGHTVFGHVYKGMDVVDAIAGVETDDNNKPETDVTITTIEITTYAK